MLSGVTRRRCAASQPGVDLAVLDWGGQGELALLHHANGFCAATLAPVAQGLRDRYRVVSVDARGHGDSTPVEPGGDPSPYGWTTLVGDLRSAAHEILAITGRDQIALGIGHSLGGALSLAVAKQEPGLFEGLVLCDPVIPPPLTRNDPMARSGGRALAEATRRRRDRFPSRAEAFVHCRSRDLFAAFTPEALALYVGEGMRETMEGEIALKCDREVEASIFDGGGMLDLFENADRISPEVLFLHARRGNFRVEVYQEMAERMPRARVESLDAGHLFPMEEPERVLEAVAAMAESKCHPN
ncbi:MAG: hypothetical protein CMJ83_03890 [Planctomycetes bacterium]|jgi:pimeloyl-ACP methyl ester carboxylesterase|nr:hypothetical protein [Planctomycetota bacterium]